MFILFLLFNLEKKEVDRIEIKKVTRVNNYYVNKRGVELNKAIKESNKKDAIVRELNRLTEDTRITVNILNEAIRYDVPVALAFGLAWSESRFNPVAINGKNNRNGSKDWGLFQLNDAFRNWSKEEYFDIELNTREAMKVLSKILNSDKDAVEAVAIYNTGATGVKRGVSYYTLLHINNVIEYRDKVSDIINEVMVE